MKARIGRKVHLGFGLALLLLTFVGWVSYRSLTGLVEAAEHRSHTLEIFFWLEELTARLADAETWQRSYSSSGQDFYLASHRVSVQEIEYSLKTLHRLTADNPRQQRRLDALEPLVEERLKVLQEMIDLRKEDRLTAEAELALASRGKAKHDEIREVIAGVKREENRLLRYRDDDSHASADTAVAVIVCGSLLSFVLVVVATFLIDHEIAVRQRAEEALRQACDELEARVRERTAELGAANAALQAEQERLQLLSRQLLTAQETERRRLSRELHDEIGQVLTAVKLNLQTLERSADGPARSARLQESMAVVERAVQQVRNLSLDLRPSLLDDLGLVAALRWYLDRQAARAGHQVQLVADPPNLQVPADLGTACFRVVQEALTNVARHAKAKKVCVELHQRNGEVQLTVRDDGAGFDVSAAYRRAARGASLGLLGMQERASLVGGRLDVSSTPSQGTLIRASFPLPAEEQAPRSIAS